MELLVRTEGCACVLNGATFFWGVACVPDQHALACRKSPLPALSHASHAVGADASVLLFPLMLS